MSWREVWMDELSSLGGISLSPAFVIMFVMQHYQLSWEDALHLVQNRRYCISPNGGFLTQIKVGRKKIIRQTVDTTGNIVTGIRKHLQSQLSGINVPRKPPGGSTSET